MATPLVSSQGLEPPPLIDRAVGDLDPLATSMRRIDPAYGGAPNRDQLFRLESADAQTGVPGTFLLQAPEFRATFSQPDYLTLSPEGVDLNTAQVQDGAYIELIPPGTVFHLGEVPPTTPSFAPAGPDRRLFQGGPIEGRRVLVFDAQPLDPRHGLSPDPRWVPPTLTADLSRADPRNPAPPPMLQPWVTAEDLREARRVGDNLHDLPIPDRVILPVDAQAWPTENHRALDEASDPMPPDQP